MNFRVGFERNRIVQIVHCLSKFGWRNSVVKIRVTARYFRRKVPKVCAPCFRGYCDIGLRVARCNNKKKEE